MTTPNDHDLLIRLNTKMDTNCSKLDKLQSSVNDLYNKMDEQKQICANRIEGCGIKFNQRPTWTIMIALLTPLIGVLTIIGVGMVSYTSHMNERVAIIETQVNNHVDQYQVNGNGRIKE